MVNKYYFIFFLLFPRHIACCLITKNKKIHDLFKLIKLNRKCDILYRGTRDGFKAANFHDKCDNKGATLTIIKVNSNIFGGYTEMSWNGNNGYIKDPNAFIFSLINNKNLPFVAKVENSTYSIYSNSSYGPTFGFGKYGSNNDIFIFNLISFL